MASLTSLTVAALALVLVGVVVGERIFIARLPNVPENWPAVGHLHRYGGNGLNQFGMDFRSQGRRWTTALCEMDSDDDGWTNGEELGDPNCTWIIGERPPQIVYQISHPGLPESYPAMRPKSGRLPKTQSPGQTPPPTVTFPRMAPPAQAPPTSPESDAAGDGELDDPVDFPDDAGEGGGDDDNDDDVRLTDWIVPHVVLGLLSIGLLVPMSISMTSFCRKTTQGRFKEFHLVLSALAALLMFIASGIAITARQWSVNTQLLHVKIAGFTISLLLIQLFTGATAYWQSRWPLSFHTQIARWVLFPAMGVLMATGYVNLSRLLQEQEPYIQGMINTIGVIHVSVYFAFGLAHEYYQYKRRDKLLHGRPRRSDGTNEVEMNPLIRTELDSGSDGQYLSLQSREN